MVLFRLHKAPSIIDRGQTQLAFEANYYPYGALSSKHKIVWKRGVVWTKKELLEHCNSSQTKILPELTGTSEFVVHWIYNNIPTALEWDKFPLTDAFHVHFRISPLIADGNGRVALIQHLDDLYSKEL